MSVHFLLQSHGSSWEFEYSLWMNEEKINQKNVYVFFLPLQFISRSLSTTKYLFFIFLRLNFNKNAVFGIKFSPFYYLLADFNANF